MQDLHIVYLSTLAPHSDYTAFGAICRSARSNNVARGIAGVLLFDGQRFCQWLHGEPQALRRLMSTIALDPRHRDVDVRFEALLPAHDGPRFWHAGFVEAWALDAVGSVAPGDPAAVLRAVEELADSADLDPPLAVTAPSPPSPGAATA